MTSRRVMFRKPSAFTRASIETPYGSFLILLCPRMRSIECFPIPRTLFGKTHNLILVSVPGWATRWMLLLMRVLLLRISWPHWKSSVLTAKVKCQRLRYTRTYVQYPNLADQSQEEPATRKLIRRSVRVKIKFAFSEPQIETLIATISRLTQEMQTLIQQTDGPYERRGVSRPNQASRYEIKKFCAVKTAAGSLYSALSRACTMHLEHQAHLSLRPVHNDPSQVQFTLAMRHMDLRAGPGESDKRSRLWLTVESVVSGTLHSTSDFKILEDLHPETKRRREQESLSSIPKDSLTESPISRKTTKKRVQFALPEPVFPQPNPCSKQLEILPNFCANENFCTQMHSISKQPINGTAACVGYLELSGCSKHLVYLKSRTQSIITAATSQPLMTLKDFFDDSYRANLSCDDLMQHQRVCIAKHLAMIILQFQATPWLDKS